jgi:hypothetical protein
MTCSPLELELRGDLRSFQVTTVVLGASRLSVLLVPSCWA